MLTITLRARGDRLTYAVDPHPAFIDLPGYETDEKRNDTEIDVHEDVAIAALVARMHGRPAIDTIPDLVRAIEQVTKERPDRTDGIDLACLLLNWAERWRTAYWDVSGIALSLMAERGGRSGVDYSGEHNERHSARNVATNDLDAPAMGTGEVERLEVNHDPEKCELGTSCKRCNRIDGTTLQREEKLTSHGGGKNGRVRKDRPTKQNRDAAYQRLLQDDGHVRDGGVVAGRVSRSVRSIYANGGQQIGASAGEVLEVVGLAVLSGMTFDEVKRRLQPGEAA